MGKDYYELKDVILGLRNEMRKEYVATQKLKESVCVLDKKIKDYEFIVLNNPKENGPKVIARFNATSTFAETALVLLGFYKEGKDIGIVIKDSNGNYCLSGFYNTFITQQEKFSNDLDTILNSDFVKQMSKVILDGSNDRECQKLTINPINISLSLSPKKHLLTDYWADTDEISHYASGSYHNITVLDALGHRIPREYFNEYQKNIIDNNPDIYKKIILDGNKGNSYYFENDGSHKLILRRKK